MKDWSEAEDAFANTPNEFRDESFDEAVQDMNRKRNTCTCGLEEIVSKLKNE